MKKKVLVTGISGFVGQHCALELLKQGYTVKGSVRNPSKEVEVREGIAKFIDPENQLEFCELDLTKDEGWEAAMSDCAYVLHVASPFYFKQTRDDNEFIKPAVEGTIRVLKAAQNAGIKRVVITSSTAAMSSHMYSGAFSPKDWTDLSDKNLSTYAISKTMAEKAAWDFFHTQEGDHQIELVVINPGGITGPSITHNLDGASMGMVTQMINGKMSMIPDLSFPMVDVRDVAKLHVEALSKEGINGKRFIAARKQTTHFLEIGAILKENGYKKASTKKAPLFLLKLIGLFDPEVRALLTSVGKHLTVDISDTEATFDWEPIALEKSVLDMAQSVERALSQNK
jgi:dihydroflavonol-4-reductase